MSFVPSVVEKYAGFTVSCEAAARASSMNAASSKAAGLGMQTQLPHVGFTVW